MEFIKGEAMETDGAEESSLQDLPEVERRARIPVRYDDFITGVQMQKLFEQRKDQVPVRTSHNICKTSYKIKPCRVDIQLQDSSVINPLISQSSEGNGDGIPATGDIKIENVWSIPEVKPCVNSDSDPLKEENSDSDPLGGENSDSDPDYDPLKRDRAHTYPKYDQFTSYNADSDPFRDADSSDEELKQMTEEHILKMNPGSVLEQLEILIDSQFKRTTGRRNMDKTVDSSEQRPRKKIPRSKLEVSASPIIKDAEAEKQVNIQFLCRVCPKRTDNFAAFENHVRTHTQKCEIKCDLCRENFNTWDDVFVHRKIHRIGKTIYCYLCGNVFYKLINLKTHQTRFHKLIYTHSYEDLSDQADDFNCGVCSVKCSDWQELKEHLEEHKLLSKVIVCNLCCKSFNDLESMEGHKKKYHFQETIKCDHCDKTFKSKHGLTSHMRKNHSTFLKKHRLLKFSCPQCHRYFSKMEFLENHTKKFHSFEPIMCEICSITFKSRDMLSLHNKKTHNTQEMKIKNYNFSCHQCQLQFSEVKVFENHMRTHCNPGEVQCDLCRVTYPTWEDVFSHRRIHQVGAEICCYICGQSLRSLSCLQRHYIAVHRLKYLHIYHDTITPVENYACGVCGSIFENLAERKQHLEQHESEKTAFKCQYCRQSFDSNDRLECHHKTFHIEKELECNICGKKFLLKQNLVYHLKNHQLSKTVQCNICSKRFQKTEYLRNHLHCHETGYYLKPFVCEICGKAFRKVGFLNAHKKIHDIKVKGEIFECNICAKKYFDKKRFNVHLRFHTGEVRFPCNVCEKSFKTQSHLASHTPTHLDEEKHFMHKCEICDKEFVESAEYRFHKLSHQGIDGFACEVCNNKFSRISLLNIHMSLHIRDGTKLHCVSCSQMIEDEISLKSHVCLNTDGARTFPCDYCGKTFLDKIVREDHEKTHTDLNISCKYCSKTFSSHSAFQKHRDSQHREKLANTCHICGKLFMNKRAVETHMKLHSRMKKYQCNICEEKFRINLNYRIHLLAHEGIEYKCEVCGKCFISKKGLKLHVKVSHIEPSICNICDKRYWVKSHHNCFRKQTVKNRVIQCKVCGETFPSTPSLNSHRIKIHNILPKFKCDSCDKVFFASGSLRKHSLSHTDKAHKCSICNKIYADKGNLQSHMAGHSRTKKKKRSRKKPSKCDLCDKILSCSSHLSRHKRNFHNVEKKKLKSFKS